MCAERRYTEQEVAAIFERASKAQQAAHRNLPSGEGLTLAEPQQIGRDTGITPEFIARAAAVEQTVQAWPRETYLGFPVGVSRSVDLPRPLTDEEWGRLVADLRETFRAQGRTSQDGALREWTNGNLRAVIEPTEGGHRLRLSTLKGTAKMAIGNGLAASVVGLSFLLVMGISDDLEAVSIALLLMMLVALFGLGSLGYTGVRLRGWAAERERQMEEIIARAVELAGPADAAKAPLEAPAPSGRIDLDALEEPAEPGQSHAQRRTRS